MARDLSKSVSPKRYAYVSNGVIYDIKSYPSECAVLINEDNAPKIKLKKGKEPSATTEETRYLDTYITDGDYYDENKAEFYKKVGCNGKMDYKTYYEKLCQEDIDKATLNYTYSTLSGNIGYLNVPDWIISGNTSDYTIDTSGMTQIVFDKERYWSGRTQAVENMIYDYALSISHKYGCELNSPKTVGDVEVSAATIASFTVSPSQITVRSGEYFTINTLIEPDYIVDKDVTWTFDEQKIEKVGSKTFKVIGTVTSEPLKIIATSKYDASKTSACEITVANN